MRATSRCRPGGAVGTARAIAHAYSVFATGGRELGIHPTTLKLLTTSDSPTKGFYDECLKGDGVQFSLGFMKSSAVRPIGQPRPIRRSPRIRDLFGFANPSCCRLCLRHQPDGHE